MKKALLILLGALSSAAWSQEVGAAGRLLQNEYQQQRQARSVIGRGGISVNIDWDYDYNRGYAEVFIRIPERGRYTVSIGEQEITNANGMYRFFDLAAVSQPLSIWQTCRTRLLALGASVDSLRADKQVLPHKRDSTHHSTDCRDKTAGC